WAGTRLVGTTLPVYGRATGATALANGFAICSFCRFLTGAGIGGEYAAINSAIQEWIPARHRGRTDLIVNGSFWIGAGAGAIGAVILLQPGFLPPDMGWRAAFGIGAVLALGITSLPPPIPERPRRLMAHGRVEEAEALVDALEERCRLEGLVAAHAPATAVAQARSAMTASAARAAEAHDAPDPRDDPPPLRLRRDHRSTPLV